MQTPVIQRQPLVLPGEGAPKLRYRPLPGLEAADYVNDYIGRLGQTGVFDHLATMGLGFDFDDLSRMDLSAIGVLGSAFTRMLSSDGGAAPQRLREVLIDHCTRFNVQAWDAASEEWCDLSSVDAINQWLGLGHHLDLISQLGSETLRPLWSRLSSSVAERRTKSAEPSLAPPTDG